MAGQNKSRREFLAIAPAAGMAAGAAVLGMSSPAPGVEVQDEGIILGKAKKLDFTGGGVTATLSGDKATVNVPTGGGSDSLKVKVTSVDTTEDFLNPKIAAGTGITKTVLNPGANEQLQLATHAQLHATDHLAGGSDDLVTTLDTYYVKLNPLALQTILSDGIDDILDMTDASGNRIFAISPVGASIHGRAGFVAGESHAFRPHIASGGSLTIVQINPNSYIVTSGSQTVIILGVGGTLSLGATTANTVRGYDFAPTVGTSPGGTISDFEVVALRPRRSGAQLTTNLSFIKLLGQANLTSPLVTSLRGLWIAGLGTGYGTVTTAVGLDIDALGVGTTRFGIRQSGTVETNRLSGKTRIGDQTAPTEVLEVLGNILATTNLQQNTSPGAPSGLANANAAGSSILVPALDHQHKRDVRVRKNTGADVGTRNRLNLVEGSNVTLTVADDSVDDEIDVTIAAASGTAREQLEAVWSDQITKTNIGTAYVDIYNAVAAGRPQTVDFTGMATFDAELIWDKVGTGTQAFQVIDADNAANVLFELTNVVDGENDAGGPTALPAWATGKKRLKPQAKSTTGADDPIFHQCIIRLKP